jgi:hypothetical protein
MMNSEILISGNIEKFGISEFVQKVLNDTILMYSLSKISTSSVALPLQLRCKGEAIQSKFKMSSFFANKLDK